MTRLALQRAINAEWVDIIFEEYRERQYTRELPFSTVVDIMSPVAPGLKPSLHAAAQRAIAEGEIGVSFAKLYENVNHAEPTLLRALVRGSAARFAPVVWHLAHRQTTVPHWRVTACGSSTAITCQQPSTASPAAHHALGSAARAVARHLRSGDHLVPGEDAHAGERVHMPAVAATAGPGELWIADRNFATRACIGCVVFRGAAVLVREHGRTAAPVAVGSERRIGRCETGIAYEQSVDVPLDDVAEGVRLRRKELSLNTPTGDGDRLL